MTVSRAALAICAVLAASCGAARADDAFAQFHALCLATNANQADAIAAADKAGWMPIPKQLMEGSPIKSIAGTPQGRIRTTDDGMYVLITGDGLAPIFSGVRATMCAMVAGGGSTPPDFFKSAADYAAVPQQMDKQTLIYAWREENGKHVSVVYDGKAFANETAQSPVEFIALHNEPKLSFIVFGIASKQP